MTLRFCAVLLVLAVLALEVSAHDVSRVTASVAGEAAYAPGEVLVKVRPGVTLSSAQRVVQANRSTLTAVFSQLDVRAATPVFAASAGPDLQRVYRLKMSAEVQRAIKGLSADPNVEYAEPNYLAHAATVPNDPLYGSQWALAKINAPAAWNVVTGTPGVVITLIDSGVDTTHSDLAGQLWLNPGETPGNGIDDDNNGFVDDVNGWNFVGGNNDVSDDNGHGTQVAGVAGAATDNAIGLAGVCWNCRLMIVKAMQAGGVANYSDVAAAVNYAASKGAQVINLSLGGYADSATLRAAIEAASATAVIVGGAGNDNASTPFYPTAYSNVLAVASTTISDAKASFSNYGAWVDVAAPGVAISTTLSGGDYGTSDGTSLSAPMVSGLAGLIRSLHPDWSPALIRAQIIHTTDAIFETQIGSGRVNAANVMQPARPLFAVNGYSINGTPNGRPEPNSGAALTVTLSNDWLDATNVIGTLSESDPFVTVATNTAEFGNIGSGVTQSSAPFSFTVVSGAGYNHPIGFMLNLSANGGTFTTTLPLTITTRSAVQLVSGVISTDTVWTSEKTYVITGNVLIPVSTTLTIQAGTSVKFEGYFEMLVKGQLIAIGTPQQRIRFTSNKSSPKAGDWRALVFADESTDAVLDPSGNYLSGSTLQFSDIEFGGTVLAAWSSPYFANDHFRQNSAGGTTYPNYPWDTSAVTFETSQGKFPHNIVEQNLGGGVKIGGVSDVVITNTVIQENTAGSWAGGVSCIGTNCRIFNSIVQNNHASAFTGGIFSYGSNVVLQNNLIAGNTSNWEQLDRGGGAFGKWGGTISATNNTFVGNSAFAIFHFNCTSTSDSIDNNNIVDNRATYLVYLHTPACASQNISMTNDYWGTTETAQLDAAIYDFYDNFSLGVVNYLPMRTNPISTAPAFLWKAAVSPNPVGIQPATVTLTFSAPMDQDHTPLVEFYSTQRGRWLNYTTSNSSLPSNQVQAITVDRDGSLWFATGGGAVHKVGATWITFNTANSGLPNNYLTDMAIDSDGSKWFTTFGYGVVHYNGAIWTVYNTSNSGLPTNELMGVVADGRGTVWFITSSLGVVRFDGTTWTNYNMSNSAFPGNLVQAGAVDINHSVWFAMAGTTGAIAHFNGTSWTVFDASNSDLPAGRLHDIAIAPDGVKWLSGDGGVVAFDGHSWRVYSSANSSLPNTYLGPLAIDKSGTIWLGVNGGVALFNGDLWAMAPSTGLPYITYPSALSIDDLDAKWLGGNGVSMLVADIAYSATDGRQWPTDHMWQATYDISALVARGTYSITVDNAIGLDGLAIPPNSAYTFTVDYAGGVVDTTPPPAPSLSVDICRNSTTSVAASWSASDPNSAITLYRYALGSSTNSIDAFNWTDTGNTSVTRTGLNLVAGQRYYFSVKARNTGGLWSEATSRSFVAGVPCQRVFLPLVRK